jgi:hypothetical protein
MGFGILLGAWLLDRRSWRSGFVAAIIITTVSIIDTYWGYEIGHFLGSAVRSQFIE